MPGRGAAPPLGVEAKVDQLTSMLDGRLGKEQAATLLARHSYDVGAAVTEFLDGGFVAASSSEAPLNQSKPQASSSSGLSDGASASTHARNAFESIFNIHKRARIEPMAGSAPNSEAPTEPMLEEPPALEPGVASFSQHQILAALQEVATQLRDLPMTIPSPEGPTPAAVESVHQGRRSQAQSIESVESERKSD